MRAKEYFELIDKKDFQYIEETKQALDDLYKLRLKYPETKKYLRSNLDAEYSMQPDKYQPIRKQLREIVQHDKSFSFFYAESSYYEDTPLINTYLTKEEVQNIIDLYKEEYDKKSIDEYIKDSVCKSFYTENQSVELSNDEWLEIFRKGLSLFDKIRVRMYKTASANEYLKQYPFADNIIRKYTIKLIYNLLKAYDYDLNEEQITQKEHLVQLIEYAFINNPKAFEEKSATSNIKLTSKKGERSDFVRVIDALYECGFFVGLNDEKTTKQDMIRAFEIALNDDFKDYHNLKASAKRTKNSGENSQMDNVFDRLKAKNRETAKKKNNNINN